MKHKLFPISLILLLALLIAIPVQAITFGQLDGNRHPNVGALIVEFNGSKEKVCTGTLISPTVFLTAAHCVNWLPAAGVSPGDVWVTFDSTFDPLTSIFYPATYYTNPDSWHDMSDPKDVAVLVLDAPLLTITPATLPPAGLLDQMKADGALKNQTFVAVGYGQLRDDKTAGPHSLNRNVDRRYVAQSYNALTQAWLKLSMNPSTGDGGTCYGDSGGPHFLGDTNMVVAITVIGDAYCRATDVTYRTDNQSARDFLAQFVSLP